MPRLSSLATAAGAATALQRPRFEVADIVRAYGAAFRATHHVSHAQARVLRAIAQCRTAALGGHVELCETCGTERICYNSCRNRPCPQCQGAARAKWLAAEQALLLPVPYFHLVFTLPHQLNPLVRVNQRALYNLVFQVAVQTLQEFARDPTPLGAELGIPAVLHTWGQTLTEHVHVHGIVTGGGLSTEGTHGRPSHPRFLFAVQALSPVFRGKYLAGLRRLRSQHKLHFVGESAEWAAEEARARFLRQVRDRAWVVYAKPPWGGPQQVLKYLSRYTHRVAIATSRLVFVGDGVVRFRYKDYRAGGAAKIMELQAEEFLRRFLLHVVPPHFVRIRHFGLLATRARTDKLARCRQLLAVVAAAVTSALPTPTGETPAAGTETAAPAQCPACGGGSPVRHNHGMPITPVSRLRGRLPADYRGRGSPTRYPPLTSHDRFPSVCVPSLPPVTTRSGRLAPVCSALAPRLSPAPVAVLLTTSRVACAFLRRCGWPRGGTDSSAATIGSAPQTR